MRKYFYQLLRKYISLLILPQNSVVEIDATTELLVGSMPNGRVAFRDTSHWSMPTFPADRLVPLADIKELRPDYLVLSGVVHYERDIQRMLSDLHALSHAETRLIITYFSSLWRPFTTLAVMAGPQGENAGNELAGARRHRQSADAVELRAGALGQQDPAADLHSAAEQFR